MRIFLPLCFLLLFSYSAFADDTVHLEQPRVNLHFQTTYIYQYSARFHSPYSGINSLSGDEEKQNSLTATLYIGVRLWKGAMAFVNPELAGGSGLSGARGMAGSSNGETYRVGDPAPTLYLARAYLSQTIDLGGGKEWQDDDANMVAHYQPKNYLRFTAGKFCLSDFLDNNAFSSSPREQFMNWSLMNNGAWDFAANVRGYTLGFATQFAWHGMDYKIIAAMMPKEANGEALDDHLGKAISINAEVVRAYKLNGKEGHLRLLGYLNRTHMGNYEQAIALPDTINIDKTQLPGRKKIGLGLNADQQLTENIGFFGRVGWNDGKTETWCFTEIDRTLALGLSLDGKIWHREDDNAGIAIVANGLSKDHRNYLAAGGYGFIVGDGKLNYAPESIAEIYYSWKPVKTGIWLSGDYQFCMNPAYNKDRGPANIISFRLHVEF